MRSSLNPILILVVLLVIASCSNSDAPTLVRSNDHLDIITGNGAVEGDGYYFSQRTADSVTILFKEPFLFVPTVNLTNKDLVYSVKNLSEWGFVLSLGDTGFWKDALFVVEGNLVEGTSFCRDSDKGNDTFFGGTVYSKDGIHMDICTHDEEMRILKEYFCDGTSLAFQFVECEYNCYDARGPAFCVNDVNVKEPCDDQFPGSNFLKKEFVNFNGRRYYDYCIGQIHGTRKELAEYVCEDIVIDEVNHFCEFGCAEGRCLTAEEYVDPDSLSVTFFAYTNSSNVDDWIRFQILASDAVGLRSLNFYEFNGTDETKLTWESCTPTVKTCNATWKVGRPEGGIITFIVRAVNFMNLTSSKNLTLNFSGDIFAPKLTLNISPIQNQIYNFTSINASAEDEKGVVYLAIYEQIAEAQWVLLQSTDCKEATNCTMSFRFNSTKGGEVQYILKSLDINDNAAFEFGKAFYYVPGTVGDIDPPLVNFTSEMTSAVSGDPVIFTYSLEDTLLKSVRFYKKEPDFPWSFISSLDCGNDLQYCEGEFTYINTAPGDVGFLLNVSDDAGNYKEASLSITYILESNDTNADASAPNITLNVIDIDDGVNNFTRLEYKGTDDNTVTYMNVYEKKNDDYELLRTKFCFKQVECMATYDRPRLLVNTTFLIVASDANGNRAELEETYGPG